MRAGVVLALAVACAPGKPEGSCLYWDDCGEGGACEYAASHPDAPGRYECSFSDPACESGRAYGEFASLDRRGTCVELSSGFDGICDGITHGCDPGFYCELGRCLSVRQLDATGSLVTAMCADDGRTGGDVYLWGFAFPLLGATLFLPTLLADAAPYSVPFHFESKAISVGDAHLCVAGVTEGGEKRSECIGDIQDGAVSTLPVVQGAWGFLTPPIMAGPPITNTSYSLIAAGKAHTCATNGRGIACWGDNARGQLDGVGTSTAFGGVGLDESLITHLSVGATFSCAGTVADVWCWGDRDRWTPETFADPMMAGAVQPVVGLSEGPVTALDAGETHVCAVKGGLLWCWGGNATGQASGEASTLPVSPTRPLGDTPVLAVAAGRQHTCAVTTANEVFCWGDNAQNQLGSPVASTAPVKVPLPARAIGTAVLAAGDDVTCALLEDSWVHCWGAPQLTTNTGVVTPEGEPVVLDRLPILCP